MFIEIGFVVDSVIFCVDAPFVTKRVFPVLEYNPPQYPSNPDDDDNFPKTGCHCAVDAGNTSNLNQT